MTLKYPVTVKIITIKNIYLAKYIELIYICIIYIEHIKGIVKKAKFYNS